LTRLTPKRLMVWGLGLLAVSWFIHLHTTMTPGLVDRVGRFKGSDYVQFYVMGSLVGEGRADALYDAQAHLIEGRRRIDPNLGLYAAHPNYGPQVALAFVPLAALPYGWSLAVFLALSGVCYAFSVWIVWRDCEALRRHGRVVAVLAAASPLLLTVVRYGQASAVAVLALALALAAFKRGRLFLAGVAIGCLAYKPQLGVLLGVVLVAARQWRVVGGATTAVAAQMAIAWIAAGSQTMMRYFEELWLLIRDPRLVQTHPSELYSIRGFVHLLVPYEPVVAACGAAALIAAIVFAVRSWSSSASLNVRFGQLIVLTILASPHLISYDLLLLTIPLLLFADWAVQHQDHRLSAAVPVALVLLYFAPFSGMIVARLTGVQIAVVVMALLAWWMDQVSMDSRAIVAPRWAAASSQNSTTSGWRSSAA
jgi:alpha-1,2-mannosyltransferase